MSLLSERGKGAVCLYSFRYELDTRFLAYYIPNEYISFDSVRFVTQVMVPHQMWAQRPISTPPIEYSKYLYLRSGARRTTENVLRSF
jgi:hypothetical protein